MLTYVKSRFASAQRTQIGEDGGQWSAAQQQQGTRRHMLTAYGLDVPGERVFARGEGHRVFTPLLAFWQFAGAQPPILVPVHARHPVFRWNALVPLGIAFINEEFASSNDVAIQLARSCPGFFASAEEVEVKQRLGCERAQGCFELRHARSIFVQRSTHGAGSGGTAQAGRTLPCAAATTSSAWLPAGRVTPVDVRGAHARPPVRSGKSPQSSTRSPRNPTLCHQS